MNAQFSTLSEFFAMGGDAVYVWTAYGIFAALVAVSLIQPRLARRRILKQLRARQEREEQRP